MPKQKLHVDYSNPVDDIFMFKMMVKLLPEVLLKKAAFKMNAPKSRPKDAYDLLKQDCNEIIEVEENKVWLVTCKTGGSNPKDAKGFGFSLEQKVYDKILDAAKLEGENAVEQAKKDWKTWEDYCAIGEEAGKNGEWFKANQHVMSMVVVKLKSGDVLLYCPFHIHDGTKLDQWLKDLGTVKYVVIGSCYHTNYLPSTTKKFPEAKVIGTTTAEAKLNVVVALPRGKLDYNLLSESDIDEVNGVLTPEGVTLTFTKGDMLTHSIFLLAYETGLEVDLLYGHHSDCACDYCNGQGIFEGRKSNPEYFFFRMFEMRLVKKPNSPYGYLPPYRFSAMDPTSTFSQMNWPRPANDGSSCKTMANSLRDILKLDYKNVVTNHWGVTTADDFRKSIEEDWKWLDGSTLLS